VEEDVTDDFNLAQKISEYAEAVDNGKRTYDLETAILYGYHLGSERSAIEIAAHCSPDVSTMSVLIPYRKFMEASAKDDCHLFLLGKHLKIIQP
jgi:hypothetical protein